MAQGARTVMEEPTLELVLRRNPQERLKREKSPLVMLDELPALIATGYADIAEEDIVRLKWWGLYHDKPKVGTFMLRIKLPAGRITPQQLHAVGELSNEHGRGAGELTTRQTIQLHYLELASLPLVFARLRDVGLTTVGACGDAVRNVTGCPVAGLARDELFDVTELTAEITSFFYGNPDYSDLPRKHKITVAACAHRCNAPEINCISLVGALRDGAPGFAVLVGGGLSSVPRLARELGVWVRPDEALPVLRALLDAWKEDLRYRISRVKARMKFMVDDRGADGMRAEVERRLGYALPDFTLPALEREPSDHMGVEPQHEPGTSSVGAPVHLGLISGDQMIAAARLAGEGDVRVTRQQNLVLTGVSDGALDDVVSGLAEIGFPVDANRLRGSSIGCTGEPHCNFAVTETKSRLGRLIEHLEGRFGDDVAGLRLHLDGCPHACGQHWVGDIGFQGTTVRDAEGKRRQAYDVLLRGALGPQAAIGRPVFRRVPSEELDAAVEGLVAGWLGGRDGGESFRSFCDRHTDDELGVLIGREPARSRREEEEAA
ncbi:Sulfite reductase beta subunit [Gaiella occulta]|uniref:assimilatory sulfite reductase (ferredoxin) n=1 Tax=Gaiella occulta TaxID=1002870 RepID=A0A7M2Z1C2_9ACTN|nr:nitrite/sulfite reductase [Gaiella occulta]RDI76091.1 Sulfite reductase beta subunit [Gaiella occulta]